MNNVKLAVEAKHESIATVLNHLCGNVFQESNSDWQTIFYNLYLYRTQEPRETTVNF